METKLEQIAVKAVNQLPKSVVREIRTPRSVGAGGGRPPPATRWDGKRGVAEWLKLPRPSPPHRLGFDLPVVKPVFEEFIAHRGVTDRVRFQGGNFFEDPLPKVDVIVMGHILHDWDLAQKKVLLGKAFDALPKGGAVVVYDAIIDDDRRENAFGLMMSLCMLIETAGGFDYTGQDCQAWMREVGFSKTRVEPLVGPDSMAIGLK